MPGEPRVVLGWHGLGVAYLVPDDNGGYREIAGEGGHAGFAPATVAQAQPGSRSSRTRGASQPKMRCPAWA